MSKKMQAQGSFADTIERLEEATGLTHKEDVPLLDRVETLEMRIFGRIQPGSLASRIDHLNASGFASPKPEADGKVKPQPPVLAGDYYAMTREATGGKVMRFKTMPIPVLIEPYPDPLFVQASIAGFETWEAGSKGIVRFTQVDDPGIARIRVVFRRLGTSADNQGCTLGAHTITKWKEKAPTRISMLNLASVSVPLVIPRLGAKYSVPPQIIEVNLDLIMQRAPNLRYQLLKNVVAHELGHALGLLGHSPDKGDLMYSVTDENSRLSQRDVNTITRLYQEPHIDIPL